jgi:hypothetical protein
VSEGNSESPNLGISNEDPARQSKLNTLGGRKFAYLIILTAVLAGFMAAAVFHRQTQMVMDALEAFFMVYMFIAVSIVAGNVVEKLPWKK